MIARDRVSKLTANLILLGIGVLFVLPLLGGVGYEVPVSLSAALLSQLAGLAIVALWAMIGTAIAALIVSMVIPMRVGAQEEADGLDASQHGQQGWDFR